MNKKRILLVAKQTGVEPLGLMYLHSAIKGYQQKCEVDFCLIDNDQWSELIQRIETFQPDFIGFSVWTGWHMQVKKACQFIREHYCNIKIIIGGPHTSWFGKDIDYADFVVVGSGCKSILKILGGRQKKIHRDKFSSVLPFLPYRKGLYGQYPEFRDSPIKSIINSTGCAFRCKYCYRSNPTPELDGLKYRNVKDIIQEAKQIFLQYPQTKVIFFQDDVFGFRNKWLSEFSRQWSKKIKRPFACQFRLEMVNDKYLTLLKKAGCIAVTFAFESSNKRIKQLIGRPQLNNAEMVTRARLVKSFGFNIRTEQMLGLPTSSIEDDLDLLKINVDFKPTLAWTSIYVPYRGTLLGEFTVRQGLYNGNNDDLPQTFFERSLLNFAPDHRKKIEMLQRIYTICAKMENGHIVAKELLDTGDFSWNNWYRISKENLYHYFYNLPNGSSN